MMVLEIECTCDGVSCTPVPGSLRSVPGGQAVDIRVHDPASTTSHATVNVRTLQIVRPTHVGSPTIDRICDAMRAAGRGDDLVHYAGACHRDDVAWQMVLAWMADPEASEVALKERVLATADRSAPSVVTDEQIIIELSRRAQADGDQRMVAVCGLALTGESYLRDATPGTEADMLRAAGRTQEWARRKCAAALVSGIYSRRREISPYPH